MLFTIGLSHKTAPLLVRERLSFAESELPSALRTFRELPGVREALVLSTCNRTEVCLVGEGRPSLPELAPVLGGLRGVNAEAFAPFLILRTGEDSARHLLRVAGGLESMIVGESQILGQVRRAFAAAREEGAAGPVLHRLLQVAMAAGRRVRTETALGRHPASVPHAALSLCQSLWGSTAGRTAGIVGAGEMAQVAAKAFSAAGVRVAVIANRTLQAAQALAGRYQAAPIPLDVLAAALPGLDVLVVSAGAERPIVDERMLGAPRSGPLLVIDIGVPRGVDPAVGRVTGITLYDLDALAPQGEPLGHSPEDLRAAEAIVDDALEAFMRWLGSRAAVPVIAALHQRAEQIVESELARAGSRLKRLDERERRAVRGVVEGALRKLLHGPFVRLRARAGDGRAMELARELFDLDGEAAAKRDE